MGIYSVCLVVGYGVRLRQRWLNHPQRLGAPLPSELGVALDAGSIDRSERRSSRREPRNAPRGTATASLPQTMTRPDRAAGKKESGDYSGQAHGEWGSASRVAAKAYLGRKQ